MIERLHPADVETIAALVAAHVTRELEDRLGAAPTAGLVDAAEVAQRFGVTAEWVRDHADELGVVRLGDGPRPRLRFDLRAVAERIARSRGEGSQPSDAAPRRRSLDRARQPSGTGVPLLPIRGQSGVE